MASEDALEIKINVFDRVLARIHHIPAELAARRRQRMPMDFIYQESIPEGAQKIGEKVRVCFPPFHDMLEYHVLAHLTDRVLQGKEKIDAFIILETGRGWADVQALCVADSRWKPYVAPAPGVGHSF